MTWEMIELKEGEPVVFLAVHALRWRQEWGEPAAGFVQSEVDIDALQAENERLLNTVKLAYRKHHLDDCSVGWEELSNALFNTLCDAMGDIGFDEWLKKQRADLETKAGSPQPKDIDPIDLELQ